MIIDQGLFFSTSPGSSKRIECKCDGCGKDLMVAKSDLVARHGKPDYCQSCCKVGKRFSDKTKAKMSSAAKGRPKSQSHRDSLARAGRGLIASHDTKLKMSVSQKARMTSVVRRNLSVKLTGIKRSDETKKKMSESKKGPKHPCWNPDRQQVQFKKTFRARCLRYLRRSLDDSGLIKDGHARDILGYSYAMLQSHIVNHPNWSLVRDTKWEIDHIFPISAFLEYGITDVKLINGLDNLQPLSKHDNLVKNDKYDRAEFEKWLKTKEKPDGPQTEDVCRLRSAKNDWSIQE